MWRTCLTVLLCALVLLGPSRAFTQQGAPLKNDSIVSMVKDGLPESMILSVMQSNQTAFDVSPAALAELKKAGVSQKVIDTMVAATSKRGGALPAPVGGVAAPARAAGGARPAAATAAPAAPAPGQPYVQLLDAAGGQNLAAETSKLVPANTKGGNLDALAGDSAVLQAVQVVATEAATYAAGRSGSAAAGSLAGTAAGAFGGLMKRKATLLYVWALPGQGTAGQAATNTPKFAVNYAGVPGVNPAEFAPALVRLVPTTDRAFRLVGAAKGKEGALESPAPDWDVYSSFVEEMVPAKLAATGPGQAQLEPTAPLPPGEYAVVVRPLSRGKKFSGVDLANQRGEAALFNSVWSFVVPPGAR